ncbi:MAG: hypothetical protein R3C60_11615 [Parvularculaceae bacterium]
MRWIISENWLNAQEFLGREINVETILSGYDLVLSLLRPYFVREESNVMSESREAIRAYLEKTSTACRAAPQARLQGPHSGRLRQEPSRQ